MIRRASALGVETVRDDERGYPPALGIVRRLPNGLRYRIARPSVARDLDRMTAARLSLAGRESAPDPAEGVAVFEDWA